MDIRYISFTHRGHELAKNIAEVLGGEANRCNEKLSLNEWTKKGFAEAEGLVFIGAVGIAVRAVAPFLKSKDKDPAVVVVDECGSYAIPILSGHLGGANALAERIGEVCGAVPVITTATDINGVFAVDLWAKKQGCAINDIDGIKKISGKLLEGREVKLRSDWNIKGKIPKGVLLTDTDNYDFCLSIKKEVNGILQLIPRIAVLGIGCRRDTHVNKIEDTYLKFIEEADVHEKSFCLVTSIDLKKDEKGILEFCRNHNLPYITYSTEALNEADGSFTKSAFVKNTTGVDNVCERSAVIGSQGKIYRKKFVGNGVTMALALKPFMPDWRWLDE